MIENILKKCDIRIEELISTIHMDDLNLFSKGIYSKHLDRLTGEVDYFTKLEWVLRHSQAAKKMMLSSLYMKQATFLYENKMKNLVFYSLYYSIFNAFLSNIILLPYLNIDKVIQISHGQALTEIENYFVRKKIYSNEMLDLFLELKMWREAYSYHLPLSGISYDYNDYKQKIDKFLPVIYQTSELLSCINYLAWDKRVVKTIGNYEENQQKCDDLFFKFVKIEDDKGRFFQIDNDDYSRQSYLMRNSEKPMPLSWFISEKYCEDLECNWEQADSENDFDINEVARYINKILEND